MLKRVKIVKTLTSVVLYLPGSASRIIIGYNCTPALFVLLRKPY